MQLIMIESQLGSIDGFTVNSYKKGKTYNIPEDLANVFIGMKVAKIPESLGAKIENAGVDEEAQREIQKAKEKGNREAKAKKLALAKAALDKKKKNRR